MANTNPGMMTKLQRQRAGKQARKEQEELQAATVQARTGTRATSPATRGATHATPVAPSRVADPASVSHVKRSGGADDDDTQARAASSIDDYPDIADVLPDLCTRYREIAAQMKSLESERRELSDQILPLMQAVDARSITDGATWTAIVAHGKRSSISREKLLENGVDMPTIVASTVTTEYDYVQVRDVSDRK